MSVSPIGRVGAGPVDGCERFGLPVNGEVAPPVTGAPTPATGARAASSMAEIGGGPDEGVEPGTLGAVYPPEPVFGDITVPDAGAVGAGVGFGDG